MHGAGGRGRRGGGGSGHVRVGIREQTSKRRHGQALGKEKNEGGELETRGCAVGRSQPQPPPLPHRPNPPVLIQNLGGGGSGHSDFFRSKSELGHPRPKYSLPVPQLSYDKNRDTFNNIYYRGLYVLLNEQNNSHRTPGQ